MQDIADSSSDDDFLQGLGVKQFKLSISGRGHSKTIEEYIPKGFLYSKTGTLLKNPHPKGVVLSP